MLAIQSIESNTHFVKSFIVEKQLKRKFIDVFLDLMRHLLREIEITCNRGLSGFHWK